MLGIETALQVASQKSSQSFYESYSLLKHRLSSAEYQFWSASFPGGNDHGALHIYRVLEKLDRLLGDSPLDRKIITPHELFLAMMAVLYHDVGILRGRQNHAISSAEILQGDQNTYIFNDFERELIAAVVVCHSSSADIRSECSRFAEQEWIGNDSVRPCVIAALVRLADELDEDFRRADRTVAERLRLAPQSEPFWLFCQRILGIRPIQESKDIVMNVRFESSDDKRMVQHDGDVKPFLQFFAEKLSKINKERITVNQFLPEELQYKRIRVSVRPPKGHAKWRWPREFTFNDYSQAAEFVSTFPELMVEPASKQMADVLDQMHHFEFDKAEANLQEIESLGNYMPSLLRLRALYNRTCIVSLRAQVSVSDRDGLLDRALVYLQQLVEFGLGGAWEENGLVSENEIYRMGRDSDLWCLLSERRREVLDILPDSLRKALPKRPPAKRERSQRGGGGGCVPAGTLVQTPDGDRRIDALRPGDRIFAMDVENGLRLKETQIVEVHAWRDVGCLKLNGTAVLTASQPLYAGEGSWMPAGSVLPGMSLVTSDGETIIIDSVEWLPGYVEVYTLTCQQPYNNYLAQGMICHNATVLRGIMFGKCSIWFGKD